MCFQTHELATLVWKLDTSWAFGSRLALSDQNPIMELQAVDLTRTVLLGRLSRPYQYIYGVSENRGP